MLNSLINTTNPFASTEDIHRWILRRNQEVSVSVEEIPFSEMEGGIKQKMEVCTISLANSFP